ncbi:MAG: STAS domain-containing protein [Rhodanobacteraceae bacterium]|nr:STAS domain-containing protein [Rhodanobacteraceae bacterium]HPF73824.1 STAS domain-containing protein [Xanthomonadaceae bacterium]HRY00107.1 STAS domain-containing protein [Xanthomonadaceae bacterium]
MKRCQTEDRGDYQVVVLSGEVDLSWSQQVRREVLDALKLSDNVAVDLSAVSYIDSSGIAALVEGFQQARGKGQRFVLLSASQPVMAVLKLARLDKVFHLVDSLD